MTPAAITILVISIVFWLICGFLSMNLHSKKGYSGGFLIGFLLGLIGLIYCAGLPDLIKRRASTSYQPSVLSEQAPIPPLVQKPEPAPEIIPIILYDDKNNIKGFQIQDTIFSVGDVVHHPTLGEGIITEITEQEFSVKLKNGLTMHPDIKGNRYTKSTS